MFTQRISMDCTYEQYEKYLKDELLKMGYKEYSINCRDDNRFYHISNNYDGYLGDLGTIREDSIEDYDRHYLGSFNAELFLALAAMTSKAEGNYGEYVIGLISGRFYRMGCNEWIQPEHTLIRKATKDEIMAKFGENKTENGKEIAEKLCNDINRLKREVVNSYIGQTINQAKELEAISLLKSKGYKILKPKTWEEI